MMPALVRGFMVACCLLSAVPAIAATGSTVHGTFALQGKVAQTSASLTATTIGNDPLDRRLDIAFTKLGTRAPIRSYDIDMTKFLHLVIVSDDFTLFLHVHPVLQKNGHFIISQRLPFPGLYHIYADARPHGIGQQVFRFDLQIGRAQAPRPQMRDLNEQHSTAYVGGYTVKLSTTRLHAGYETMLGVQIFKNGKPARDLHPYLGALAHAVFLQADDLSYVHAHPMPASMATSMNTDAEMEEMKPLPPTAHTSPDMMLHVALNEPGVYKLWLQFRGGNRLLVAPFVLTAQ